MTKYEKAKTKLVKLCTGFGLLNKAYSMCNANPFLISSKFQILKPICIKTIPKKLNKTLIFFSAKKQYLKTPEKVSLLVVLPCLKSF